MILFSFGTRVIVALLNELGSIIHHLFSENVLRLVLFLCWTSFTNKAIWPVIFIFSEKFFLITSSISILDIELFYFLLFHVPVLVIYVFQERYLFHLVSDSLA